MDAINMDKSYAEICRLWLIDGLNKPGKSQAGLWRAALGGIRKNRTKPNKWVNGGQPIKTSELPGIAAYIEEQIPPLPGTENLPVRHGTPKIITLEIEREIGIDTWRSEETLRNKPNIATISLVDDGEFRGSQLRAYKFKGDSMDGIGILNGDVILCVSYEDTSATPLDGKPVVIERVIKSSSGSITEVSLRIAKVFPDDSVEFITDSKSGSYKPIIVDRKNRVKNEPNEKVRVVAVWIGSRRGYIS